MGLNSEDIESFGFRKVPNTINDKLVNTSRFVKNTALTESYTLILHWGKALEWTFKGHNLAIRRNGDRWSPSVFMGHINDRSELETLLKQLNIWN